MNRRDPLVFVGLAVVTLSAAVSSFGALDGTARLAGWSPHMAALLPITVDATAAVATRVWLSPDTPTVKARRFARSVAVGAITVSLLGNGVFHLANAGYLHPGVWLVIGAGGISPLSLAVVAHLAVLRGAVPELVGVPELAVHAVPELQVAALPQVHETAPRRRTPRSRVRVAAPADAQSWDALLDAARQVDHHVRSTTGRPAGVSRLRADLRIGQARAQRLRDELAALPAPVIHALPQGAQ